MKRIVLHVGPEKCGSTTIQHGIVQKATQRAGGFAALHLSPADILPLDMAHPDAAAQERIHQIIKGFEAAQPEGVLILSHEMLFKLDYGLFHLTRLCRVHAEEVRVVGFVRRQSDFLVSGFGQWLFRAPERLAEARAVLAAEGIAAEPFLAVERQLIAALLGGWHIGRQLSGHLYFDWSQSVPVRAGALAALGSGLSMGLLPRAGFTGDLCGDFLERAGIAPMPGGQAAAASPGVKNAGFAPGLIEGVVAAIETGHPMPGPHEGNDFLAAGPVAEELLPEVSMGLVERLKDAIDTAFEAGNARFAERWGVPEAYFLPRERVSPEEIRAELADVAKARMAGLNTISADRARAAEAVHHAWEAYRRGAQG